MSNSRSSGGGLSPWQQFGMGTAAGAGIGGGLYNLFGNPEDPSKAAGEYLDQIPDTLKQYFEPYIKSGLETMPQLQQQFLRLMQDPSGVYGDIAKGYQQSPGYDFRRSQAEQAARNAMGAGGMTGSPAHGEYAAGIAEQMANKDFNEYIKNAMGLYGKGLSGAEGIATRGQQAGMGLGEDLANTLSGRAGYEYAGAAGRNQREAQGWEDIFGGLGSAASLIAML